MLEPDEAAYSNRPGLGVKRNAADILIERPRLTAVIGCDPTTGSASPPEASTCRCLSWIKSGDHQFLDYELNAAALPWRQVVGIW